MDSEGEANTAPSAEERRNVQVDNAIRAIQEKKPVPEIDFTIHTMEDNTQVSTMERVCKGSFDPPPVVAVHDPAIIIDNALIADLPAVPAAVIQLVFAA
ncbi:3',5'-cyclic-nucleotide phosphodiesterase (PDEase) (3':5'-CNP) [Fusarium irregulare]|nr:3',5'-cyclic-nucleotide phosphodiesterase (PDEase) (3':5'-CNP) [Fusarium irregulare]